MPAKVDDAFARGVSALFKPADKIHDMPKDAANVFFAWNSLAAKFPNVYPFANVAPAARSLEEKLLLFYKCNPKSANDREWLAALFMKRLEHETADTLEAALKGWWEEVSHD